MLCPVCLEENWHRTWCEHHPAASLQQGAWPPALQVASSDGGWMQQMGQLQTDDGNLGGVEMNETPLVGLLSLDSNVSLGGPMNQVPPMGDDELLNNEPRTNELTWNIIEDVLREDSVSDNVDVHAIGSMGPHTPINNSPTQEVKIERMWVSANDLAKALAKFVEKTGQEKGSDQKGVPQISSVEPMASTSAASVPECCKNGTCSEKKRDSPRSPDVESVEEREREWRSDTSDNEVREPYRPEVSSISSDVVDGVVSKDNDTSA
jgi:hypothetical protein